MTDPTAPDPERDAIVVNSPTEERNPRTLDIDRLPTIEVLRIINDEDQTVAGQVAQALPDLAKAVDLAVAVLQGGGRVHYFGAGTSGRLALIDAVELVPTFAVPDDWFVPHHAGGPAALVRSIEDSEDDAVAGEEEAAAAVEPTDLVLGLSASGRTPYVLGALEAARRIGARTVLVSGNPAGSAGLTVDVLIGVDTGPEVIAGSTRMKAGTAQKLVLNAFSTAIMIRLGRTYSNLMVSLVAANAKLRGRLVRILVEATGHSNAECERALVAADGDVKTALVAMLGHTSSDRARQALADHDGHVRGALAALRTTSR